MPLIESLKELQPYCPEESVFVSPGNGAGIPPALHICSSNLNYITSVWYDTSLGAVLVNLQTELSSESPERK